MARNNLGLIMMRRGRVKEAEKHYLAGLASEPGNSLLASNLRLLQDRETGKAARE
jgi:Flp pilus assembly protein TadD